MQNKALTATTESTSITTPESYSVVLKSGEAMINGYKDLIVWQKSMDLVDEVYKIIRILPTEERFALSDQMRRSAISIPSNIAEGYERKSKKEYIQFLSIAKSSRAELETQLYICIRQNYITHENADKAFGLCNEVGRILNKLISKVKSDY